LIKDKFKAQEKIIKEGGIPLDSLNNKYREIVNKIREEEHQIEAHDRLGKYSSRPSSRVKVIKQSRFTNNPDSDGELREAHVSETSHRKGALESYAKDMKLKMRDQFRSQFQSSGNLL
jgi:hypothetical protein